jgi:hypothetical protein
MCHFNPMNELQNHLLEGVGGIIGHHVFSSPFQQYTWQDDG